MRTPLEQSKTQGCSSAQQQMLQLCYLSPSHINVLLQPAFPKQYRGMCLTCLLQQSFGRENASSCAAVEDCWQFFERRYG